MLANIFITLAVSLLSLIPENGLARDYNFADGNASGAELVSAAAAKSDTTASEAASQAVLRPVIGLSTNLPYDITYLPNYGLTSIPSVSLEYYPARGHWTFGADVEWSHWRHYDSHRFNQIHNITLNARRYFRDSESLLSKGNAEKGPVSGFYGLYLAGSINAAQYGIGWNAKGWEGEGLGVSLGIGYKCALGRRMYLDLGVEGGYFYSRYDPYLYGNDATKWYYYDYTGDPAQFVKRRMALNWFGPTRVYISLGINLFDRNRNK